MKENIKFTITSLLLIILVVISFASGWLGGK